MSSNVGFMLFGSCWLLCQPKGMKTKGNHPLASYDNNFPFKGWKRRTTQVPAFVMSSKLPFGNIVDQAVITDGLAQLDLVAFLYLFAVFFPGVSLLEEGNEGPNQQEYGQ